MLSVEMEEPLQAQGTQILQQHFCGDRQLSCGRDYPAWGDESRVRRAQGEPPTCDVWRGRWTQVAHTHEPASWNKNSFISFF